MPSSTTSGSYVTTQSEHHDSHHHPPSHRVLELHNSPHEIRPSGPISDASEGHDGPVEGDGVNVQPIVV